MTVRLKPGPPASQSEGAAARERHQVVKDELPRVRAAALAWRNGVAGLLAALVGFGLIRGRNDINALAPPYDVVIGVLLLLALISGTVASLLLLRAAHGRPAATTLYPPGEDVDSPLIGLDHIEALSALRALRAGLVLAILCGALLCAAVATTWYGPTRDNPAPQHQVVGAR